MSAQNRGTHLTQLSTKPESSDLLLQCPECLSLWDCAAFGRDDECITVEEANRRFPWPWGEPLTGPFTVSLADGSTALWGKDEEAAYEVGRDGHLRVIVFSDAGEGLGHAATAHVYATDEWIDVQRLEGEHRPRGSDGPGVAEARALLVGREVSAVSFVRDYVELHFDGPVVRAISEPLGMWGCSAWRFPKGQSLERLHAYIGLIVDDFVLQPGQYAQLAFGEHSFTVPLDDESRKGPEALHVVGVDSDGRTDASRLWIW